VVGCTYPDRLLDSAVAARAHAGLVLEIAAADGVDRERVLMLHPGALFIYPFGSQGLRNTLKGVPMVPVAEYLEEHPLGRAEWIKAFGMLFGLEYRADSLYRAIAQRYGAARSEIPDSLQRPAVFFGSSWRGTWSVPPGNSYMAWLIHDAGGRYLFAGRTAGGNIDLDLETVLAQGAAARYWGRILAQPPPVRAADVAGGDGRILALPAFRAGGAFYANSTESDLFGKAALEPDVVLRDLIGIFHPGLQGDHQAMYFRPVQ
jgi:iron complex transport system substrate-binding protein